MNSRQIYYAYKKARRKFSMKTYILLMIWLIIALIQWLVVCLVPSIQAVFRKHYYISVATFILAIVLFALFLFFEKLRYQRVLALFLSFVIVELQTVSLFTFVSRTYFAELLMYFMICAVLITLFLLIGLFLPRKMDLTLHIALIFILAFLFLLVAVFFLMLQFLITEIWRDIHVYGYLMVQIPITITMLFFVMYHAQTINGGRFAEMRLHDYCLGSLILFHDFLIIYWLTFYWQLIAGAVTPTDWTLLSTPWHGRDKNQLPDDYDDYADNNLSKNIYGDGRTSNAETTADDNSKLIITQDFNEDKNPEALNDEDWKINWLAQENRYRYAKRLNVGHRISTVPEESKIRFQ